MDKTQLMNRIQHSYDEWKTWLLHLDEEQMLQPGMSGDWCAKDIIAHITWHEREMVNLLRAREFGGSELWQLSTDERNAAIYELCKDRNLNEVRAEAALVHMELLHQLVDLPEEALQDPAHFPGMPLDWRPWQLIAENTYEHYEDHCPQVKAWLERKPPQAG